MLPVCCRPSGGQHDHVLSHGQASAAPSIFCFRNSRPFLSQAKKPWPTANVTNRQFRTKVLNSQQSQSAAFVVSDQNVPEGHKGLHGFLYGDKGADVHDSETSSVKSNTEQDDGTSIVSFQEYISAREGSKFAGIYAVYDSNGALQYIGYSRNVVVSLRSHIHRLGNEKCDSVRVKMFTDPRMISRSKLDEERRSWLSISEALPPGNSSEKHLWDVKDVGGVMSEVEKMDYEEKKLKMRKALGENLYDDVEGEEDDAKTRRLKLLQATEGDDWSNVIDGQNRDAVENMANTRSGSDMASPSSLTSSTSSSVISPFDQKVSNSLNGAKGLYSAAKYDLTVENVDMVLNDVRPYLIADGGNVEVVSVENGIVSLRLQGACGTCPSSTVTMKMGIERVLKEKFEDQVKEVVQVDQQQIQATVSAVNAHLDILRPAIQNYGGSVEVLSVQDGECRVKYNGPPPIGMGIQAAIKDKFPDIKTVTLLDA